MPTHSTSVPIDRGWAWVIVGAAFMNATILIGMFKCFGMFFAEILEMYHKSASGTSTMLAISGGLSQFIGPLVMAFSDMYTCRVVSMIGGMFCCLGFLVPAYCTSAEQIVVTFGIFTGLGYGMCLLPGTVIVGRYFERHRSLANGLLFSGGGVGGMIVPLVLNYIIEQLGFRSALVILAGFALQTVVFASLYRPLTYWTKSARALTKVEAAEEKPQAIEECKEKEGPILLDRLCSVPEDRCLENGYAGSPPVVRPGRTDTHFRTSLPILPAYEKQNHLMNGTLQDRGYGSANIGSNASIYFSTLDLAWTLPPKQEASVDRCESVTKAEPIVEGSQDQAKPTRRNSKCKAILRRLCYAKAADGSELPLLDFSLMKEKRFLLFVISAGFFIPIIYIAMVVPPHCLELGMTKSEVAILLSIQGGADTAGRLITAAFGDRSFIKDRRKSVGVACFIVLSVTTYTAVFLNTFWGQASYLLVSSLARGAFVAMMPVILVDLVGVEHFSRALGLQAFVQAFAVTICPVVIGALRDWTMTYTSGLIFMATCFAMSALSFTLIVAVDRRKTGT